MHIYSLMTFVLDNITFSTNLVQQNRFKQERIAAENELKETLELKSKNELDSTSSKAKAEDQDENNESFFESIRWMLEFNGLTLSSLIVYLFNVFVLLLQIISSFLYVTLSTERDPITKEFLDYRLRFAESIFLLDSLHSFDSKGRCNLLFGLIAFEFVIFRIRTFYVRLRTAQTNRYKYKDLNIVNLELGHANNYIYGFKSFVYGLYKHRNHECYADQSLSGRAREKTLEFNRKVKQLSKVDQVYRYNQISFNECFKDFGILEEQMKRIKLHEAGLNRDDKAATGWFNFRLPNRYSYVAEPEHKIDLHHEIALFVIYSLSIVMLASGALSTSSLFTYVALLNGNKEDPKVDWSRLLNIKTIIALFKLYLTTTCYVLNVTEHAMFVYPSVFTLSRSSKVTRLLSKELKSYRAHLRQFTNIYEQQSRSLGSFPCYSKAPNIEETDQTDSTQYSDYAAYNRSKIHLKVGRTHLFAPRKFSFIRRSDLDSSFISNNNNKSIREDREYNEFFQLVEEYRNSLDESVYLEHFNQNMAYILDLVELLKIELKDQIRFFELHLNIVVIFGTLSVSGKLD